MSDPGRLQKIMRRREQLCVQCELQRLELSDIARQSEGAIKVIDRAIGVVNYVRGHPVALGFGVALLVAFRRRQLWGWARRGFMLWRAIRSFGLFRSSV